MVIFLIALYGFSLLFILCYSLMQLNLTLIYRKHKKNAPKAQVPEFHPEDLPLVTVQLPVYNELYVIERLIDAVANFNYPADKLEIQVLDDSTDETSRLITEKVAYYTSKNIQIKHIQRPERTGYKAGALQYGLERAAGEFIAIFDADFIPDKLFLLRTVPYFQQAGVGVVQSRWGHLNQDYSLLTRLQAFGLNAHFSIEQKGRNLGSHFINFNGTAGIWRKSCILDAGGWQADTLTEDLDLSYRAQLKGWKFKYLEELESPAELPAAMPALKSQQYRWTKGAAETARKHLKQVITQKLPFKTKLHAGFHLLNSAIFLSVLLTALLSVPMLFIKHHNPGLSLVFNLTSVFLLSIVLLSFYYWTAYQHHFRAGFFRFIPDFFLFLSMSMGLSLHNAVAVMEGYAGRKTPFVRTPKFNIFTKTDTWKSNRYNSRSISLMTILEGLLALYFVYGIYAGIRMEDYGLIPFHFMLALGFSSVFGYSISHSKV